MLSTMQAPVLTGSGHDTVMFPQGMEDWDQAKLEEAIASKHEGENQNIKTEIICRFFLEAVEKKAYGW